MLRTEGEFFVKKVMSWEGGNSNFAVNLEPNSLLTPSQIQIFWLKIHPLVHKADRINRKPDGRKSDWTAEKINKQW